MKSERFQIKQRVKQTLANVETGVREPRSIGPMVRAGMVEIWRSHGGGFYGLGYVITFVVLEVQAVTGQVVETVIGEASLVVAALEWLFRFGLDTLLNIIFALIWPVWVLQWLAGWGVLLLAVGFLGFDRLLRPIVERFVPELAADPEIEEGPVTEPAPSSAGSDES